MSLRGDGGGGEKSVFRTRRPEEQLKTGVLGTQAIGVTDHADIDATAHERRERFTDTAILDKRNFIGFNPARLLHGKTGEITRRAETSHADSLAFQIGNRFDFRPRPTVDG